MIPEFKYDFKGEEINVLLNASPVFNWDMMESDDLSDRVSMAIFERNCKVEESINVSLNFTTVDSSSFAKFLNDQISSDMNLYDFVSYGAASVAPLMMQGAFKDLKASEYLNLDASWWNASYNAAAGMFDKQFTMVGDLNLSVNDLIGAIYFNADLFNDYGFEKELGMSLYECVLNGEWTLETLQMLTEMGYTDLNGDGTIGADDGFGLIGQNNGSADAFRLAFGVELAVYDEANNTMVVEASDRTMHAMDCLNELWSNAGAYRYSTPAELNTKMSERTAIFMMDVLDRNHGALATALIDTDVHYGILPMPKMDLEQDGYRSGVLAIHNVIAVMDDSQAVCVTLDAMSAYSASIQSAYEDYLMRGAADSEIARDVLGLVIDSAAWDFVSVYNAAIGNPVNLLWVQPFTNNTPFMISFNKNQPLVQQRIGDFEALLKH